MRTAKNVFIFNGRSKGWGGDLICICLDKAKEYGYEKCYLETLPNMLGAQKLYKKWGFEYLDARLGEYGTFLLPGLDVKEYPVNSTK